MVCSAAVSDATTQPRSSRPNAKGRTPWASRAAYSVFSSMKTKQKAPLSSGSTSSAAVSIGRSGSAESSVVTSAVSEVLPPPVAALARRDAELLVTRSRSSIVLMRFPLCANATDARPYRRVSAGRSPRWSRRSSSTACARPRCAPAETPARLVEDLADQAHVLVDEDLSPSPSRSRRTPGHGAAGRRGRVGELGDVLAGRPDAEDAAGVLWALVGGVQRVQVVRESSVSARHASVSHAEADGPVRGAAPAAPPAARRAARRSPRTSPRRRRSATRRSSPALPLPRARRPRLRRTRGSPR